MGGAVFLTAGGVDAELIEEAMVDFGMPMGPATLSDLTVIDQLPWERTFERRLGARYKFTRSRRWSTGPDATDEDRGRLFRLQR